MCGKRADIENSAEFRLGHWQRLIRNLAVVRMR